MTGAPIPPQCEHPGCCKNAQYLVSWLFMKRHWQKTCEEHIPPHAYSIKALNTFGPPTTPRETSS
jgi:hypothetical protein